MKKLIIVIAAILVMAPFHSQAATHPTDAQILKMRATCKGVQCDFIPLTTGEMVKLDAAATTTQATSTPAASSFAKAAPEKVLTSKETKALKKLDRDIAKLNEKLERLEAKRLLLLGE